MCTKNFGKKKQILADTSLLLLKGIRIGHILLVALIVKKQVFQAKLINKI